MGYNHTKLRRAGRKTCGATPARKAKDAAAKAKVAPVSEVGTKPGGRRPGRQLGATGQSRCGDAGGYFGLDRIGICMYTLIALRTDPKASLLVPSSGGWTPDGLGCSECRSTLRFLFYEVVER